MGTGSQKRHKVTIKNGQLDFQEYIIIKDSLENWIKDMSRARTKEGICQ